MDENNTMTVSRKLDTFYFLATLVRFAMKFKEILGCALCDFSRKFEENSRLWRFFWIAGQMCFFSTTVSIAFILIGLLAISQLAAALNSLSPYFDILLIATIAIEYFRFRAKCRRDAKVWEGIKEKTSHSQ